MLEKEEELGKRKDEGKKARMWKGQKSENGEDEGEDKRQEDVGDNRRCSGRGNTESENEEGAKNVGMLKMEEEIKCRKRLEICWVRDRLGK